MNNPNVTMARLYMLFALLLLVLGWKICHDAADGIAQAQAAHEAEVNRMLSLN
jgi:hypothetical protein